MLVSLLLRYVPSRLQARTWRLGSLREEGGRVGEREAGKGRGVKREGGGEEEDEGGKRDRCERR